MSRAGWTDAEDKAITSLVQQYGLKAWTSVAARLAELDVGPEERTGKQVRSRWINHLDPTINTAPWTQEENDVLYDAQKKHGNKWTEIAKHLPGR
jgi:hypothetical protein